MFSQNTNHLLTAIVLAVFAININSVVCLVAPRITGLRGATGIFSSASVLDSPSIDKVVKPRRASSNDKDRSFQPSHNNGDGRWDLKLYNDEENYEFWVAAQLVKIAGLSEIQAFHAMKQADASGEALIAEYDCWELAEHFQLALQAEGLRVDLVAIHEE